jgi:meso-butanediol dehydrogenase/(S,S)-butanediol dehydrogenase/diacetyl reductase
MSTAVVDLAGQVALVTGGASGIGAGIARVLGAVPGRDPAGRPRSADDIGYACAYLASGAAANITGEALNVSGGQQMH